MPTVMEQWDNRSVLHHRDEFATRSRRVTHRSQIKGDRPFLNHLPNTMNFTVRPQTGRDMHVE